MWITVFYTVSPPLSPGKPPTRSTNCERYGVQTQWQCEKVACILIINFFVEIPRSHEAENHPDICISGSWHCKNWVPGKSTYKDKPSRKCYGKKSVREHDLNPVWQTGTMRLWPVTVANISILLHFYCPPRPTVVFFVTLFVHY